MLLWEDVEFSMCNIISEPGKWHPGVFKLCSVHKAGAELDVYLISMRKG